MPAGARSRCRSGPASHSAWAEAIPAGAAAQIRRYADGVRACERMDSWLFGMPFLAVALHRSGRRAEALAVVEEALAHLPGHGSWLVGAALTHTHAVLLAADGSPAV